MVARLDQLRTRWLGTSALTDPASARTAPAPSEGPLLLPHLPPPTAIGPARESSGFPTIGRPARAPAPLEAFGAKIQRIGPPLRPPFAVERGLGNLISVTLASPWLHNHEHRTQAALAAAAAAPPAVSGKPFGDLAVVRPGLGNVGLGPAAVARLSAYADKVLVVHAHRGKPDQQVARPATELNGVPLPAELAGRVYEMGSPEPSLIGWDQASDLFVEQLEQLRVQGWDLSKQDTAVVAFSQGGPDALAARMRLDEAGRADVISRLVAVASPLRGTQLARSELTGAVAELGAKLTSLQAFGAIAAMDPDSVQARIPESAREQVDLAVVTSIDFDRDPVSLLERGMRLSGRAMDMGAWLDELRGREDPAQKGSDGLVDVEGQRFGRSILELPPGLDHAGAAEAPRVIDDIARALAGKSAK